MGDKAMEIILPKEIAHYEGELRYFFDSMIRKLFVNRAKGFAEGLDFQRAVDLTVDELNELTAAVRGGEAQFAAWFETVDVANMAFITGLVLSRMSKDEYKTLKAEKTYATRETSESNATAACPPLDYHPDYPQTDGRGT